MDEADLSRLEDSYFWKCITVQKILSTLLLDHDNLVKNVFDPICCEYRT